MRANEAFIFVYDITNKKSLEQLKEFTDKLFQVKDTNKIPIMLIGNKSDLDTSRQLTKDQAKKFALEELGINR